MKLLKRLYREEEGVTAIEYGLIAALVAVVLIVALQALGLSLVAIFDAIAAALGGATASP